MECPKWVRINESQNQRMLLPFSRDHKLHFARKKREGEDEYHKSAREEADAACVSVREKNYTLQSFKGVSDEDGICIHSGK
jgi:hypothetical protein